MQEGNDKVLLEKTITECSISLLKQHHAITFKQHYSFNI